MPFLVFGRGSFAVHIGIICGPIWGSFPVWGSFAVGDHLRRCTDLRNTHTRKHSRNLGGDSSQAFRKQLIVKTKRKSWPCLVMKLNFITIAWNFGFLEYSSSHSASGIKSKIQPRKNYKINLFKFPVLHTRCFWRVMKCYSLVILLR